MFDISNSNQSEVLETSIKAALYKSVYNTSRNAAWIRSTGLGLGIVTAVLKVARQVALIAENIIKGFGNIFGYFFYNQCSFRTGMYQLLIETPRNIICLPFTVISAAHGILLHTVKIASDPVNFSYEKWCENDPVEVANNQQRIQRNQFLAAQSLFNGNMSRYQQDNTDVAAIKFLAKAYEKGNGVKQDTAESIKFFQKAAQLNDIDSIKYLADAFCAGQIVQKMPTVSFDYYMKAANLSDIDSIYEVGQRYRYGFGTTKDFEEALKWYQKAANNGHSKASSELMAVMTAARGERVEKQMKRMNEAFDEQKKKIDEVYAKAVEKAVEDSRASEQHTADFKAWLEEANKLRKEGVPSGDKRWIDLKAKRPSALQIRQDSADGDDEIGNDQ